MKANKTKHLIYELTQIAFGNRDRDNKRLHDMCQLSDAEIQELERQAKIGSATEKAFESGFSINQMHSVLSNVDYCMYDKESLLNWAESEGE